MTTPTKEQLIEAQSILSAIRSKQFYDPDLTKKLIKNHHEIIDYALQLAIDMQWRDIESANMEDGNHMLLWRKDIQFVGYYAKAGWCTTSLKLIDPEPTHWMPLPTTPEEDK